MSVGDDEAGFDGEEAGALGDIAAGEGDAEIESRLLDTLDDARRHLIGKRLAGIRIKDWFGLGNGGTVRGFFDRAILFHRLDVTILVGRGAGTKKEQCTEPADAEDEYEENRRCSGQNQNQGMSPCRPRWRISWEGETFRCLWCEAMKTF